MQAARRGVSGPTLIRLLTRLTDTDLSEPRQSLSDRLSLWLGWTDAIALSTILEGGPLAVTTNQNPLDDALTSEYERMRATLTYAIADEKAYTADVFVPIRQGARPSGKLSPVEAQSDYAIYRKRYQAIQQAMETTVAKLRVNLRAALTAQTPERARLALMDAILERSLSVQERRLFAMVPTLLEKHFARLRESELSAESEPVVPDEPSSSAPTPERQPSALSTASILTPSTTTRAVPLANTRLIVQARTTKPPAPVLPLWLRTFRKDMRSVLTAELDIRLQPIEGLLAALRDS